MDRGPQPDYASQTWSDKMGSCLEFDEGEYRLFGHAVYSPTAKYMCHQREIIVFGQRH